MKTTKVLTILFAFLLLISCASKKKNYHPELDVAFNSAEEKIPEIIVDKNGKIVEIDPSEYILTNEEIEALIAERDYYKEQFGKEKIRYVYIDSAEELKKTSSDTAGDKGDKDVFTNINDNTNSSYVRPEGNYNFFGAITVYTYSREKIYDIFLSPRNVTDICLQAGENISNIVLGDPMNWTVDNIKSSDGKNTFTHVLIRPQNVNVQTDCMIATDRRVYYLRLVSTATTHQTAVEWRYSYDELNKTGFVISPSYSSGVLSGNAGSSTDQAKIDNFNRTVADLVFNYDIEGKAPWKPLRVYSDGMRTYIQFTTTFLNSADTPVLYLKRDGKEEIVNFTVKGVTYIVPFLLSEYDELLLKTASDSIRIKRNNK